LREEINSSTRFFRWIEANLFFQSNFVAGPTKKPRTELSFVPSVISSFPLRKILDIDLAVRSCELVYISSRPFGVKAGFASPFCIPIETISDETGLAVVCFCITGCMTNFCSSSV